MTAMVRLSLVRLHIISLVKSIDTMGASAVSNMKVQ